MSKVRNLNSVSKFGISTIKGKIVGWQHLSTISHIMKKEGNKQKELIRLCLLHYQPYRKSSQ